MEESEKEFSIYKKTNELVIKRNNNVKLGETCLIIKRNKESIPPLNPLTQRLTKEELDEYEKIVDAIGIIGIIQLSQDLHLIAITKAELICRISKKEKIYKVLETKFISFSDEIIFENLDLKDDKSDLSDDEFSQNYDSELIKLLKKSFINGFYFSNNYDLANSITSHNQIINYYREQNMLITNYDYIVDGNKNFLSNWKLTESVISNLNDTEFNYYIHFFFSNCIFGNIEHFSYKKYNMEIILISRRYLWNYGMFNYRKGLSKYGGNSNQIETELILIHNIEDDNNRNVYSFIYLSSYLPIFFKEKKNTTELSNNTNRAFIKYMESLINEYNVILFFVIKNENEDKYILRFKNMLEINKGIPPKWKYFYIDTKIKKVKDVLNEKKDKQKDLINFVGFNNIKSININKEISQIGIFSFLGMDDKTLNQNQFYLVYDTIYHFLIELNKKDKNIPIFLKESIDDDDLFEDKENQNQIIIEEDEESFIDKLKKIFKNRMKELTKQYYMNYDESLCQKYQRINEILFGKNMKFSTFNNYVKEFKEYYCDLEEIKIFVGSWNTGCTDLTKNKNIRFDSWLMPKGKEYVPDIYFIGLQEVVELKVSNILLSQEKQKQILNDWDMKIRLAIEQIGNYKCLSMMNLVGINFYCYVLEEKIGDINNFKKKFVKTGLGGAAGNKGSCCINFNYKNTSFSVGCSHLAAGAGKNEQRIKELKSILNLKLNTFLADNTQVEDNKMNTLNINSIISDANEQDESNDNDDSTMFKDSDVWIFFGDLNFRVDMDYDEFSKYIGKKDSWNKLLEYDQFIKSKTADYELKCIQEDEIKFPPTYKYCKNSNDYDYTPKPKIDDQKKPQNKKKRNPSWCDRIFYKNKAYTKEGKKIITGKEYNNIMDENFMTSDHRPVYNIFDIVIFKEDENKKGLIQREISANEKLGISNKYLKKKKFDY
jgi:hypothetical protein